jgi:tetratricopeptide (TPR) repeat protein
VRELGGRRVRDLAAILVTLVACAASAADPSGAPTWRKIKLPELVIITTLPEEQAAGRAREFAQYLGALRTFFAPAVVRLRPATLVIFARKRDFLDYRPLDKAGRPEAVGGFFLRHESWAMISLPASAADDVRHTLFHEGAHWFMDGAGYANALWLNEGMAEVFSTFRVEGGEGCWGELLPEHVKLLRTRPLGPLEELVFTSRDRIARDEKRTSLFYAESWAFVHMLLFGETDLPKTGLSDYNRALAAGVNAEGAFATSFGLTYEEMDAQLAAYVRGERHHLSRQPVAAPPAIRVEPATEMEVDEALGRLALVGNRHAVAIDRGRAMTARDSRDPRGHALLGVAYKEAGELAIAQREFELATQHATTDFQPYFELGNALQVAAVERGGDLSPTTARQAADDYEAALERYDAFEGGYANLAGIIGLAEPLRERDVAFLRAGAHRFPDNAMISLGMAQWYYRADDHDAARALVAEVRAKTAPSSSAGGFARQLAEVWDNQEFFARVSSLMATKRYDEASRLVDERPVIGADWSVQLQLTELRRDIKAAQKVQALNQALASEQWEEARRLSDEILASPVSPVVKASVRRTRASIDRR